MKLALITLSAQGCRIAETIATTLPKTQLFVHKTVSIVPSNAIRFERISTLTEKIFTAFQGLVYIVPCGVVVRAIADQIRHKTTDPAIVVIDVGARYAISLLGGHEGGANNLAVTLANIIGAEPVISTTTEAVKAYIVGIGCRRGIEADAILAAIEDALAVAEIKLEHVRLIASADIKQNEIGLSIAAKSLGIPLRFIASEEIRTFAGAFDASDFVLEKVNLPAVAEPSALLAGRRTTFIVRKKRYPGITIAIAKENCMWSE